MSCRPHCRLRIVNAATAVVDKAYILVALLSTMHAYCTVVRPFYDSSPEKQAGDDVSRVVEATQIHLHTGLPIDLLTNTHHYACSAVRTLGYW